jgi:hypothetical protein
MADETGTILSAFIDREFDPKIRNSQFTRPLDAERRLVDDTTQSPPEREILAISNFLDVVFGGQAANPNRVDLIARLNAAFSETAYIGADYRQFSSDLERALSTQNHIAIIGPRGSGKTLSVNKWLNERTKPFLEAKLHYNWFRIDVTKLYDLLRSATVSHKLVSMMNYFMVHSAYVFLEYSGALPNPFSKAEKSRSEVLSALFDSMSNLPDAASVLTKSVKIIQTYYDHLKILPSVYKYPSETIIFELFNQKNYPYFEAFQELFHLICQQMKVQGFGILAIVDGIDNISWSRQDSNYIRMCHDAKLFFESFEQLTKVPDRKIMVVARPETVPEISLRVFHSNTGEDQTTHDPVEFCELNIPRVDPDAVLQRKMEAATTSDAFDFARRRCRDLLKGIDPEADENVLFNQLLSRYQADKGIFVETFCAELNDILQCVGHETGEFFLSKIKTEDLARTAFDDDVRAIVDCFRRAKEGQSISARLGVKGHDKPGRLPEYFLLGSRFYLNSATIERNELRYSNIPRGEVFPNIFWYDTKSAGTARATWHGLCGLRMLQLATSQTLLAADTMYFLHEFFGYSPDILIEHLEAFVAFGLLNVDHRQTPKEGQYCPAANRCSTYTSWISTTYKGKLLASLSLYFFNWIYFLALDTPLHSSFLLGESGDTFVRFHRNPSSLKNIQYHFFDAIIPTVAVFARHIWYYHSLEMRTLVNRTRDMHQLFKGLFQDYNLVPRIFRIPNRWRGHMSKNFERTLGSRNAIAPKEYENLSLHIKGNFREDAIR